ncbi:atp-binding cassette superfamily [Plasmopara halstedii]|uniref:Atp-binding cassette superfamily n=1 Tax=Plasmopara halstedii TaxID=4781 RepID=A0A0P1AX18_PLAHL|nr:atp-binding cassette superfamily [Plasmopara halstedii]CEG45162.1 atp-binding cassette superfamily [Plasmopara halstedii]|eukprot:XP_024581531.1 atp-binding cassette superfamily [Plasmopara halstedii]
MVLSSLFVVMFALWTAMVSPVVALFSMFSRIFTHRRVSHRAKAFEKCKDYKKTRSDCPLDRASWFSRFSYHWISPFIALGKKRRFEIEDVPDLSLRDTTSVAAARFDEELLKEFHHYRPSFLQVARRLYGADVVIFALWSTANKAIGLASPLLLKFFLDWADSSRPSLYTGYCLAAAMIARSVISTLSATQYELAWKRFDLRVRAGLVSAIYARTLQLSGREKRDAGGLGRITNLISVDVNCIVGMPSTLFDMILIPVEIIVALVLLSKAVSVASIAGVAVLVIMVPLISYLGRQIKRATTDMMHFRDERVGLTAETLHAIRTLKLLGWVSMRLKAINRCRKREMDRLQVRKYLDAFCVFFWASTPVIVQVAVFVAAVFSGRNISAADAFTAIALLDRLIYPMNYLPWIINSFLEARVSALRIRAFLFDREDAQSSFKDQEPSSYRSLQSTDILTICDSAFRWDCTREKASDDDSTDTDETLLLIDDSPAQSASSQFVLHINNLHIRPGSTYVVCGPVGAGKSSLLLALLGEMPNESATTFAQQRYLRFSYSPQTPWLFRGSVQQNITMCNEDDEGLEQAGKSIDHARYERVLRACELDVDLCRMKRPFDVAENGSNFSGGQRARLNLARALYQRADIYLLDDPFSGLDVTTASKVVANCFKPKSSIFPDDAAVVVVTHSLHLLPLFPANTQIVVMDDGRIFEQGTYHTLKAKEPPGRFMKLQRSTLNNTDTIQLDEVVEAVDDRTEAAVNSESKAECQSVSGDELEHRESGAVSWHVWKAYAMDVGTALSISIFLTVVAMQLSRNSLDYWIAVYTNDQHSITPQGFAWILLSIAGANVIAVLFRSFLFAYGGLRAARATYKKLVHSVFAAPLQFFERTPTGRVLNRLSGDTFTVDEWLSFMLNIFLRDASELVGSLAILFYGNHLVVVLLIPLSFIYYYLQRDYRPSSRHLGRLGAATHSPLLTMFTDTLEGLPVIRAARKQQQYIDEYRVRLNRSQRVAFLNSMTSAWFGLRLDLLGVCITSFVALFAVASYNLTGNVNPGILGLTLTHALPIVGKLNALLNGFIDSERQMIAVERVKEYTDLESEEGPVDTADLTKSIGMWPTAGHIAINELSVLYGPTTQRTDKLDGPECIEVSTLALKSISCDIPAGQKIGICGRTGAGKSTLLNALFRAVPWRQSGCITIDDVPLDSLSLEELRSRLTYIPQDVVLFSGTVRSNLDPSGVLDDERLWTALRKCGEIAKVVAKLNCGLDSVVNGEEATMFSQGQAQLLCIARALLRPSQVLCIDEATASIDHETEQAISQAIASEFASSTILTVAHRIQTIMHCDRVLVLDNGQIAESGNPKELLMNSQSLFYRLAKSSTSDTAVL